MEASINLGRIWGIPVGLHISWFVIFFLITWSLAFGYFPTDYPDMAAAEYWVLGAVTSVLFFASVLLHELGHSLLALRNKIPVKGITLFIFGGVAQITRDPPTPGAEFRIAIAGPLTSLGLAAIFGLVWLAEQNVAQLAAPAFWLARINLLLAVFNMIPGFPLDGGRVLRAGLWKLLGSYNRATQIASFTGQLTAFGFIGWGLFTIFLGHFFNGLWLIFIGWFLQNAAASTSAQTNLRQSLRGVTVSQVMAPECPMVPGFLTLKELVEDHVLTGGKRCFFVTENGQLRGMVTLRDVTAVPRDRWGRVSTEEVMRPWERLVQVDPNTELLEVLQLMDDANVAQVPVVKDGGLVGMLSRDQILHYIRVRGEVGI